MRKLVLGIIAVVCVQFAFVMFTNLRLPLEVSVAPVPASPLRSDPDLSWMDNLSESAVPPSEFLAAIAPQEHTRLKVLAPRTAFSRSPARRVPGSARIKNSELASFLPPRPASPGDFQSIVIRYNREESLPNCDGLQTLQTKTQTEASRPVPYVAKSKPFIKKPWEWIKAVGSRLY